MSSIVGDDVGVTKATLGVSDGLHIVSQLVEGEVGVPFVVKGHAGLGGPFGVGVRVEGGNMAHPQFLN